MTPEQPYVPLSADETAVRLCHRILVAVLSDRNRQDLLRQYDEHGARFEDHPQGIELFVGDESVIVVAEDAIRLGLQLEDANDAN